MIAPVPVHCFSITYNSFCFEITLDGYNVTPIPYVILHKNIDEISRMEGNFHLILKIRICENVIYPNLVCLVVVVVYFVFCCCCLFCFFVFTLSSPEPLCSQSELIIQASFLSFRRRRPLFQISSSPKPLGKSMSNVMLSLYGWEERNLP